MEKIRKLIDVPKRDVRKLKIKAAKADTTVKQYIEKLIREDIKTEKQ